MLYVRFILTVPVLVGLLAVAVAATASWGWGHDPLSPPGVLAAPDRLAWSGRARQVYANLVPARTRMAVANWPALVLRDGVFELRQGNIYGFIDIPMSADPRANIVHTQVRLSPEFGFGPLRVVGRLFVIRPQTRFVAIDLEAIRSSGRYDMGPANRQRTRRLLADGQTPLYLADVELADYNRLRAELESADWPIGPLVMWQSEPHQMPGRRPTKHQVAAGLAKQLSDRLVLAVVADLEDNRDAFGQAVKVVAWSGAGRE